MRPLKGQRVIDITQNVAGPYCTQILADLGADVLKIERPGFGDDTRHWTPKLGEGLSATYATLNRGKKSIAIDLDLAAGQQLLRSLMLPNDVLIHSLKPGSDERRGVGYATLAQEFPGLIYCALSAFGNIGAMSKLPGYDPLIQAYTGIMSVNGHEGTEPARVGVSLIDMGAGMWSALGIVAAIASRKETGKGTRIDTSLLETGIAWMTNPIANYSVTGTLPRRMGSATAMLAPYEIFATADAHVFIACRNDRLFTKMVTAIDAAGLAQDPRFATNAQRVVNREALHHSIEDVTIRLNTADVIERLRRAGVPVSPLQTLADVASDPQVAALGLQFPLPLTTSDGYRVAPCAVGLPIRFDNHREQALGMTTQVGQDGRDVLASAGLTQNDIDRLASQGVIQL